MENIFVINDGQLDSYNGKMHTVEIPEQVVVIKEHSFSNNSDVHRIVVGQNVKRIESNAFHGCGSLKEIVLPDGLESVGEIIIKCNQVKWIFANPGTVGEKYAVAHGIPVVPCACLDQEWYISNGKVLKCFLHRETSVVIPAGVNGIGPQVFESFRKLVSIKIPDSVSYVGTKAFRKCTSLESVILPGNVSSLGGCAFEECINLKEITLPTSVDVIWGNCFNGCISLKEIVVPKGCSTIHGLAFANCKALRRIAIPASVTFIQYNALSGCSTNLVLFVQEGSVAHEFAEKNHLNFVLV